MMVAVGDPTRHGVRLFIISISKNIRSIDRQFSSLSSPNPYPMHDSWAVLAERDALLVVKSSFAASPFVNWNFQTSRYACKFTCATTYTCVILHSMNGDVNIDMLIW